MILRLALAATFTIIKRISYAVGHEQLALTYADVMREMGQNISVHVIDLSSRLDHFSDTIPMAMIEQLVKSGKRKNNNYVYTVVQDLVFCYLYLFSTSYSERQRLGSRVGIKVTDPRLFETRGKFK